MSARDAIRLALISSRRHHPAHADMLLAAAEVDWLRRAAAEIAHTDPAAATVVRRLADQRSRTAA